MTHGTGEPSRNIKEFLTQWQELGRKFSDAAFLSPAAHHGQSCTEAGPHPPEDSATLQTHCEPHPHTAGGSPRLAGSTGPRPCSCPRDRTVSGRAQKAQVVVTGPFFTDFPACDIPSN